MARGPVQQGSHHQRLFSAPLHLARYFSSCPLVAKKCWSSLASAPDRSWCRLSAQSVCFVYFYATFEHQVFHSHRSAGRAAARPPQYFTIPYARSPRRQQPASTLPPPIRCRYSYWSWSGRRPTRFSFPSSSDRPCRVQVCRCSYLAPSVRRSDIHVLRDAKVAKVPLASHSLTQLPPRSARCSALFSASGCREMLVDSCFVAPFRPVTAGLTMTLHFPSASAPTRSTYPSLEAASACFI